jgi:hypothetical protein
VQGSHTWRADSAVFDKGNLVSHAGLVPLLELAEWAGLSPLLGEHVRFTSERVRSGAANPVPKLISIIAGMAAGASSADPLPHDRRHGLGNTPCRGLNASNPNTDALLDHERPETPASTSGRAESLRRRRIVTGEIAALSHSENSFEAHEPDGDRLHRTPVAEAPHHGRRNRTLVPTESVRLAFSDVLGIGGRLPMTPT